MEKKRWRPLSLAQLLNEIETIVDVERIPDSIVVFPPDNANDPVTDEDSGEEENVVIDNLPGPQLRAECEFSKYDQQWDSDHKRPLSNFTKRRPRKTKTFRFSKQDLHDLGLGSAVVLQYADVLQRMPYASFHLFFANYFTSLSLLKELGGRNMKGTGTIRENRIPECPLKRSSDRKTSDRGTFDYALVDDDIVICKWNDNRVVTLASNAPAIFHYIMPKDFRNLKNNMYT
nr:unnamed protein product [Callosobruchus analis]